LDTQGANSWELGDATLVFHNSLQNISDTSPGAFPGVPRTGIGLDIGQGTIAHPSISWRTVLYANSCGGVDTPLRDFGLGTVRYCPSQTTNSIVSPGTCECSAAGNADVGVTGAITDQPATSGSGVTYVLSVTNHSTSAPATAVTLFVEPSAGIALNGSTFAPSTGSCDPDIDVCSLGNLAAGQTSTVSVAATLLGSGPWQLSAAVAHQESDSVPGNDGARVIVTPP
jgi:hypothetical protein